MDTISICGKPHLTKLGLLEKFKPFGNVKTMSGLSRFLTKHRESFPVKGFGVNQVFFCEAEVDEWLNKQRVTLPAKRKKVKVKNLAPVSPAVPQIEAPKSNG